MRLLHPALAHMIRARLRARGRTLTRGFREPRKLAFLVAGMCVVALWLSSGFLPAAQGHRVSPEAVRSAMPLVLLGMWVMALISNADERALYFAPSEVNFLFAGPFTRRELLAFKLALTCVGMTFTSILFSFILLRYTTLWIAGLIGAFLTLWFIHLVNMAIGLLSQTVALRAHTRIRKIVIWALFIAILGGAAQGLRSVDTESLGGAIEAASRTGLLRYVTAPFSVFANVIAAESLLQLLTWTLAAASMDLLLLFLVVRLDTDYMEAAVDISERYFARIQRVRQGGIAAAGSGRQGQGNVRRYRLMARPPRLGGAGPIIWRQVLNAGRNARGLLMIVIFLMPALAPMVFALRGGAAHSAGHGISVGLAGLGIWITIMLTMMIRFDFRTDIEMMEWLKMLPTSEPVIVLGELTVPVVVTCLVQFLVIMAAASLLGLEMVGWTTLAFAVPLNLMLFGLENLFFLLWPTKAVAANPGDLQFLGRQMVTMLGKLGIASFGGAVAFVGAFGVWWLTGRDYSLAAATAWCVLALEVAAVVRMDAWAFRRFDVSSDMPTD